MEQMQPTIYETTADGRRLDVLLAESTGLTRSAVARLLEEGQCTVAGRT